MSWLLDAIQSMHTMLVVNACYAELLCTTFNQISISSVAVLVPQSQSTLSHHKFIALSDPVSSDTALLNTRSLHHKPITTPTLRIFSTKINKQLVILILPNRPLSSFLKTLPDSLPLSSLCLPGTHDSSVLVLSRRPDAHIYPRID